MATKPTPKAPSQVLIDKQAVEEEHAILIPESGFHDILDGKDRDQVLIDMFETLFMIILGLGVLLLVLGCIQYSIGRRNKNRASASQRGNGSGDPCPGAGLGVGARGVGTRGLGVGSLGGPCGAGTGSGGGSYRSVYSNSTRTNMTNYTSGYSRRMPL